MRGKKEKGRSPDKRDFDTEVGRLAVPFERSATNGFKPKEMVGYLERKKVHIPCYAMRKALGLRNSSNPVEKANDKCVAKRQKHNGMSWSPNGSAALAVISAVYSNGELSQWLNERTLNFRMAA